MSFQAILNQPLKLPFTSVGLTTGLVSFSNVFTLVDGLPHTNAVGYTEVGGGLYTINFTPNITGVWTILVEGKLLTLEVVNRDINTILRNIEDESLGSWQWNKIAGTLNLTRQDGSALASFNVSDTPDTASKERIG